MIGILLTLTCLTVHTLTEWLWRGPKQALNVGRPTGAICNRRPQ